MSLTVNDKEILDKIEFGLKLAIQRLYEQKAANNEMVVISKDGEIIHASARELLEKRRLDEGA